MRKYNIVSGLPRSGSTLLCAILNQNPKFHASETSALPGILAGVRRGWEEIIENVAAPKMTVKINVLRAIAEAYYEHLNPSKEVVFDKSRAWMSEYHLAEMVFGKEAKYLLCTRDVPEILASFEKIYRKSKGYWLSSDSKNFPKPTNYLEGRCDLLMSEDGPVGSALRSMHELKRYTNNVAIVDFNQLTFKPEETMNEIYQFLGMDYYSHDFDNVNRVTEENDLVHGYPELHKIRSKVSPVLSEAKTILGNLYSKYNGS
jgi:sulfotransferase